MSTNQTLTEQEVATDKPPRANSQNGRSYVLEVVGVLSGIGFFIGVFFAYQTYASGLITQREFDHLQTGHTLDEVNQLLGFEGVLASSTEREETSGGVQDRTAIVETYVWENSSISFVRCDFVDGQLTVKEAQNLP